MIIEVDEYKKKLKGYKPSQASKFHTDSAVLADKAFKDAIADSAFKNVILMCGGSASGKSELAESVLDKEDVLIYDGTLSSFEGAKVKIRNSIRKKKKVTICAVIPDDIPRVFATFLVRDRKFSEFHFFRTHSNSRQVLLFIALNYPSVKIRIFKNQMDSDASFLNAIELSFNSKKDMIKYIKSIQVSQKNIQAEIIPK